VSVAVEHLAENALSTDAPWPLNAQARIVELEAQLAAKDAEVVDRNARIHELEQLVATLTEKIKALLKQVELVNQNSRNSNRPPSTDPPGKTEGAPSNNGKRSRKTGERRKRGGQPGHRGRHRQLVSADQVDKIVDLFPPECENCWASLPATPDPSAKRDQHIELPPIKPYITEVRRHTVECPKCGHETCAAHDPDKIPASPFGPRLMSAIALLTGVYHVSRRSTVRLLSDLLGIDISLGAVSAVEARVSEAVAPAVDEAWKKVQDAPVKHTDGTTWLQAGTVVALWTIATASATVFKIITSGTKELLKPLFGALKGILVSDRAGALTFWAMELRQICWAHLLRKFVSFSERDGPAADIGRRLLDYTGILFEYWQDFREGRLSRDQLGAWMAPLRKQVEALLEKAVATNIDGVSGSCADILEHRAALWTFLDHDGVEPTNNHAEQELRGFVLWRKRSFGTQSERGNVFAERLMTVRHTARKQNRNVLEFLTKCCQAKQDKSAPPSLFPDATAG
jgi:transposase